MRVLFLTSWYPSPENRYDGVFVREHAKAVRASGDDVVVLHVPGISGLRRGLWRMEEEADPKLSEGIPTYHVRHRSVSVPGSRRLSFWISYGLYVWSVIEAFRRLRGRGFQADVIHAHVYTAAVPAVVVGRLFRLPVVSTEHYTGFPRRTLDSGSARRARFAYRRVARVLPVCVYLQRAIEAYGIRATYEVVPNAVDPAQFFPADRKIRGNPQRLIFVGALEPTHHKGFPTLLEALDRLLERRRDWHLDVVGDGTLRPEYERRVAASSLAPFIDIHGPKPKREVAEMMRASDVFVLPSRFENLPSVVIEAMASGLPIVSTTVGGIPEMVSDRDGILVPPEDPAALADALDRVLSNAEPFDGADISARATARYGLAAVGSQLQAIYSSVVSASRGEPSEARSVPTQL